MIRRTAAALAALALLGACGAEAKQADEARTPMGQEGFNDAVARFEADHPHLLADAVLLADGTARVTLVGQQNVEAVHDEYFAGGDMVEVVDGATISYAHAMDAVTGLASFGDPAIAGTSFDGQEGELEVTIAAAPRQEDEAVARVEAIYAREFAEFAEVMPLDVSVAEVGSGDVGLTMVGDVTVLVQYTTTSVREVATGGTLAIVHGCLGVEGGPHGTAVVLWPPGTRITGHDPLTIRVPGNSDVGLGDRVTFSLSERPTRMAGTDDLMLYGLRIPARCAQGPITSAG